jgi:NAD(P)-dependent dehydrogenase (short-subunit alcohol dehydrogenase family)
MPGKLQDKVCLITGSTGIAAATAELAILEGASVFVTSHSNESCTALAETLRARAGNCEFHIGDLTLPASATEIVRSCVSRFGRIDALFNVVGISGRAYGDGPVHECTAEAWGITLDTNVKTMFLLCKAVLGQMLTQPTGAAGLRGSILNMGSVLAFSPESRFFASHAYAASKGAIQGLSRAMAAYYAPFKIRVNVIAPGLVRTPMSARAQEKEEILEFMKTKQPLCDDLIDPKMVARAALFLMSDDARCITGDVLTVDAGWCVSG